MWKLSGRETKDIRLVLKDGEIIEATTSKDDELSQQVIKVEG